MYTTPATWLCRSMCTIPACILHFASADYAGLSPGHLCTACNVSPGRLLPLWGIGPVLRVCFCSAVLNGCYPSSSVFFYQGMLLGRCLGKMLKKPLLIRYFADGIARSPIAPAEMKLQTMIESPLFHRCLQAFTVLD